MDLSNPVQLKNYTISNPNSISFAYGDFFPLEIEVDLQNIPIKDDQGRTLRLGVRILDGERIVREDRLEFKEWKKSFLKRQQACFYGSLSSDFLRPGSYRLSVGLVVDPIGWLGGQIKNINLQIFDSDKFMDVKELMRVYTVEELCQTAENYFRDKKDNPWMAQKPYSIGNIQHDFPQLAFLIRGLNLQPGMTVVDYGSGTGWISRVLWRLGLNVISLDVSKTALEISQRLHEEEPKRPGDGTIEYALFNGHNLPFKDKSIDRILCNDALHHVPNRAQVLKEYRRVLRDNGIAGFCEPGPHHSLIRASQDEMRKYKVVENDMPLNEIAAELKAARFAYTTVMIHNAHANIFSLEDWMNPINRESIKNTVGHAAMVRSEDVQIFFAHC